MCCVCVRVCVCAPGLLVCLVRACVRACVCVCVGACVSLRGCHQSVREHTWMSISSEDRTGIVAREEGTLL